MDLFKSFFSISRTLTRRERKRLEREQQALMKKEVKRIELGPML